MVSDFGLAVYANGHSQNYYSTRAGNVAWLSPELTLNLGEHTRLTKEADIYSFALLCIEVCVLF